MAIAGRLGFRLKFDYGIGQAAEGLKNGALAWFLLFYYSQVLGMDPSLAAIAAGTSVIIDAFTDPMAGSLSDNWHSKRWGRRHPFMLVSALPMGLAFYLLFNPLVSGNWPLFFWMVLFANIARTAMTLYHVPHLALGAEMSVDFRERSSIVGYRVFFGTLGSLLAVVLGFSFFFGPSPEFPNGQLNASAYPPFAALVSTLMAVTIFWSAWRTRSVIPFLPQPEKLPRMSFSAIVIRMVKDVVLAMRCGSFRWLFLGVLILFIIIGVNSALTLYMNTYYWELNRNQIIILAIPYPLGVMLGSLVSPWLQNRFGLKTMLLFGTGSWAGWQAVPVILRMLDILPENGAALLVPVLFMMYIVQGICTVQSNVAYGAMVADTIDEHELATGKRQEGIFFSASSFSAKAPVGIGTIIAGFGLAFIDWPTGAAIRTAADVPTETIVNLGILFGPFVAVFGLVCLWCYSHYDLTRERHADIVRALEARRVLSASR